MPYYKVNQTSSLTMVRRHSWPPQSDCWGIDPRRPWPPPEPHPGGGHPRRSPHRRCSSCSSYRWRVSSVSCPRPWGSWGRSCRCCCCWRWGRRRIGGWAREHEVHRTRLQKPAKRKIVLVKAPDHLFQCKKYVRKCIQSQQNLKCFCNFFSGIMKRIANCDHDDGRTRWLFFAISLERNRKRIHVTWKLWRNLTLCALSLSGSFAEKKRGKLSQKGVGNEGNREAFSEEK